MLDPGKHRHALGKLPDALTAAMNARSPCSRFVWKCTPLLPAVHPLGRSLGRQGCISLLYVQWSHTVACESSSL